MSTETWKGESYKSLMSNVELYWIVIAKYIKMFKIRGTSCYDINVTCKR